MPIGKAIRKYGKENFYCGVIKSCASKEELDYWEKFYIVALKSKNRKIGYNLTDGGEGTSGIERSPEYRAKLSARFKGEKNPRYGKKNTPEHTARIVAACKGKKLPPQTCENIAAALRGKKHTKERCAHISAAKRSESPYKNLVAELDARNLSYAALAKLMGFKQATSSRKMTGKRNFTDADKVKLEEIFGKPADYLLQHEIATEIEKTKPNCSPFKNLIAELNANNFTYKALAKLLGLALRTVSEKITGIYNFTERDKTKLVEIFGKPIDYLLQRETGTETEELARKKRPPRSQEETFKRSITQRSGSLYKNLLSELDAKFLSYSALAKCLGSSQSTVSAKMHGERNFNDAEKAKLVEIFGKPIEYLLERNDG